MKLAGFTAGNSVASVAVDSAGTLLVKLPSTMIVDFAGQRICLVFGLTAGILRQHCPVASARPANARNSCDELRN